VLGEGTLVDHRTQLTATTGGRKSMGGGVEIPVVQPHDHRHVLGVMRSSTGAEAKAAIAAAQEAAPGWRAMSLDDRVSVLLKAADLRAGPWRQRLNVATMLGQSKTVWQAEIDAPAS
jgi:1-pyrroline-5-carboxylate dehydrogenase